ncbi:hypothetical protein A2U01_0086456, partial [Trifolium medium]|nr:hypothetical protein [Trifolium medium]
MSVYHVGRLSCYWLEPPSSFRWLSSLRFDGCSALNLYWYLAVSACVDLIITSPPLILGLWCGSVL